MFFFFDSVGQGNPSVRLQNDVVREGLRRIEPGLVGDMPFAAEPQIGSADTLVMQYCDPEAVQFARGIKQAVGCKIVCFGSDVFSFEHYLDIDDFVDHLILPTQLHCDIIGSAVWCPCHVLPEGIDPIALPNGAAPQPVATGTSLGWFGYGGNFSRGFAYILPWALEDAGLTGEHLTLIAETGEELYPGAVHIPFSVQDFYQQSGRLSHALLSHFAYDCHVNSYIKSPNKLITSLVRGLTPIFSATPNYLELARDYELEKLTFRNGYELADVLRRSPELRLSENSLAAIAADLQDRLSPERIAGRFLELVG